MPKRKKPTILVVDVGGNNVKMRLSTGSERRKFASGPELTPSLLCDGTKEITSDWAIDFISIGLPAPVKNDRILLEPHNLGPGWVNFDFASAFDRPCKVVNDALMQAIGSYDGGKMLFLGLGTGLGGALVTESVALPLEVAHLPYRDGWTFEDCVGKRGLDRLGKARWLVDVFATIEQLKAAMVADYVVVGGGNAKRMPAELPEGIRRGSNENAFLGGARMWDKDGPDV